jgi:hypothetical protein
MKKLLFFLFALSSFSAFSQTFDVTFKLNLKGQTFPYTTPEVNGTFNNWCGNCNQMTDANNDSIWEAVIPLPAGNIEYKFSADNWAQQEALPTGTPCTIFTPPSFNNRKLTVAASVVLKAVCWNSCDTCTGGPIGPSLQQISLPITWQDTANVNYTTTDFGGTFSSIAADPVNPSKLALKIVKGNTAEVWAGTTLGTPSGFQAAMPFSLSANQMQARVYSPAAGTVFRLKVELRTDPTISVETDATTTQANAWEVLSFDFSNHAAGTTAINYTKTYNKLSIFPNYGVAGATAGEKTYYVGDVVFGNTLSTEDLQSPRISIYPNPVSDQMQIGLNGLISKISIFNLQGQEIITEYPTEKTALINTSKLVKGLYVIKLTQKDKVFISKFTKE